MRALNPIQSDRQIMWHLCLSIVIELFRDSLKCPVNVPFILIMALSKDYVFVFKKNLINIPIVTQKVRMTIACLYYFFIIFRQHSSNGMPLTFLLRVLICSSLRFPVTNHSNGALPNSDILIYIPAVHSINA